MLTRVLVVDDERNMRTTLRDILEDQGFHVSTAASGERAVKMCERNGYDVVLMDVRMPGIDGVEAMRRIRKGRGKTCVVMMSAYSLEHLEQQALREGALAFLRKPFDVDRLIELIETQQPRDP